MKPLLLDLFCKAGGAGMGYHRAGFDVTGVDISPQPNYPFRFIQADALEYVAAHGTEYDVIHASPPCQHYSVMTRGRWQDRIDDHPDIIDEVRRLLVETGRPFIIENVGGARNLLINPIMLCGTMFGLQTRHGSQLRRHRYFELNQFEIMLTSTCQHQKWISAIGVYGGGQNPARRNVRHESISIAGHSQPGGKMRPNRIPSTIGVWSHSGRSSNRDNIISFGVQDRRDAMGIDWMTGKELSEAIPPVYTEYIGKHLIERM